MLCISAIVCQEILNYWLSALFSIKEILTKHYVIFRNRRSRESVILKAIENGAKTLFDIVAYTYADVDRSLWGHAASNVRLHVEHLAEQDKLPKVTFACFNTSISHGNTSTHIRLNINVLVR